MLKDKLKTVPNTPGCYIYYNRYDEVIYVGKAKKLRNRMSSYFRATTNLKTTKLVNEIHHFEYILTNSELESYILENNLIKKYSPRYNILLKDDKTYPFLVLTDEEHPRLIKSRSKKIKGRYYGPFSSASFVNDLLAFINMRTKLRKCDKLPSKKCLYYDINQCYGPCINQISSEQSLKEVKSLLSNDFAKLKKELVRSRDKASSMLLFEDAKKYQDLLEQLENYKVGQIVELPRDKTFKAIDFYKSKDWLSLTILDFEKGVISNISQSMIPIFGDVEEIIISSLYQELSAKKVEQIYSPKKELITALNSFLGTKEVHLNKDQKSKLDNFLTLNVHEYYKNNVDKITKMYFNNEGAGFEELCTLSGKDLKYIEMYDISHTAGVHGVGARIVCENGKLNKKYYRKYNLRINHNGDDYSALKEVIKRRLLDLSDYVPDLIIMDGGFKQVKVALEVMEELKLDIKVIGLSKNEKHKTDAIVNQRGQKKKLTSRDPVYKFVYQLQEEVHRFALDYHNTKQSKAMVASVLDEVPGIGPKRKKELLTVFGSVDNIKKASESELKAYLPAQVVANLRTVLANKSTSKDN